MKPLFRRALHHYSSYRTAGAFVSGLLLSVNLLPSTGQAVAATSYIANGYLVELLPAPVTSHIPIAMNANGVIVGEGDGNSGEGIENAVIWNADGSYTNLTANEQDFYSSARGINAAGVVVGHFENNPVRWINGQRSLIGGVAMGFGSAYDINDKDEVVGQVQSNGLPRAFIQQAGVAYFLDGLNGDTYSYAYAINELSQVSGSARAGSGTTHAVIWNNGVPTDLGTLPGDASSYGLDINDAGDVVGHSMSASYPAIRTPVIWQDGVISSLGSLGGTGGIAKSINNHGQVVGYAYTATGVQHPFLWQNGVMTDLAPLLQGLCAELATCGKGMAVAINDAGQIVGTTYVAGTFYAQVYRLTPLAGSTDYFDLGVSLTADADVLSVGEQFSYTITVSNLGNITGSGISVVDTLPNGLTLISAVASQGSCSGLLSVSCELGNLVGADTATITLTVQAVSAGVLNNSVSVAALETEINQSNNAASHSVEVQAVQPPSPPPPAPAQESDLEVNLTDSPDPARVGETLTYTARVINKGPGLAVNVELLDELPAILELVSVSSSQGSCSGSAVIRCQLGDVAVNETVVVEIRTIPTETKKRLRNTVSVQSSTPDPDTDNNNDKSKTRVRK